MARDFPGGPVFKTLPSNAGGAGSIPGQGAKIPHASWPKHQNIKQKQYFNKFNKNLKKKMVHIKKNLKKKKKRNGKKKVICYPLNVLSESRNASRGRETESRVFLK